MQLVVALLLDQMSCQDKYIYILALGPFIYSGLWSQRQGATDTKLHMA